MPLFETITDLKSGVETLRRRRYGVIETAGGKLVGNGHRSTINALIATHGTIMDLTDGIFWAASPPNQLGKFVAFDLNDFDRELPALTVPADTMPSFTADNNRIVWTIKAQLEIAHWPDSEEEFEILVRPSR